MAQLPQALEKALAEALERKRNQGSKNPSFWKGQVFPVFLSLALALLLMQGPTFSILTSAVVVFIFWLLSVRATSWGIGIAVFCTAFFGSLFANPLAVCLVVASALGGVVGGLLSKMDTAEDDFLFFPWIVIVIAFVFILWLAPHLLWDKALQRLNQTMLLFKQQFDSLQSEGQIPQMVDISWSTMEIYLTALFTGTWFILVWLAGRLARRASGRLRSSRASLLLFRMRQKYIFLLILGLILEILSVHVDQRLFTQLAWMVLTLMIVACFIEGLGVICFVVIMRRMMKRSGKAELFLLVFAILCFSIIPVLVTVIGLADIWFDLRRMSLFGNQSPKT